MLKKNNGEFAKTINQPNEEHFNASISRSQCELPFWVFGRNSSEIMNKSKIDYVVKKTKL